MRVFGDGYDFSHDLLRESGVRGNQPAEDGGCCTGASPRAWNCSTPRIRTAVAAQLAEQYARAGRPERAVAYYRRAADVAAGRFAHAEAIRLHEKALSIIARPASRDGTGTARELAVLEAHGRTAQRHERLLVARICSRRWSARSRSPESLGRKDSTVSGLVALWGTRFVQGRTADSHRTATRALALADPASELSGQAHFAVGGSAVSLGMPAEGLRHLGLAAEAGRRCRLAEHRHPAPTCTERPGPRTPTGCSARTTTAVSGLPRGHRRWPGPTDDPYSLAVALAYGAITHQMRHDLPELRERRRRAARAVRPVWLRLLPRVGADPGRLVPRRDGRALDLARRGISNLKSEGAFARMPYWLSLLADLSGAGPPARRRPRRPSTPPSPPGASTTTCGGCPR